MHLEMFLNLGLLGHHDTKEVAMDKKFKQYTKRYVTVITVFAIIWISFSYVLAALQFFSMGSTDLLENLSSNVCTVILGTTVAYMIKSFIETYSEKKNEYDLQRHEDAMNLLRDVNTDVTPDEIVGMYKKI